MADRVTEPRERYADAILEVLTNVGDWIAIDAWIGGGKIADTQSGLGPDPQTYSAFRAVSSVVAMAVELADTAVQASSRNRSYAVAAITRQLVECEYLLALFEEDLNEARVWAESAPQQIRKSFAPSSMRRRLGRFSNDEYRRHCSLGGHPAPDGIMLLERMDPRRSRWPMLRVEVEMDLGLHLRRIWEAIDSVLSKHHARYARVRADQRQAAEKAWTQWLVDDTLVATFTGLHRAGSDDEGELNSPDYTARGLVESNGSYGWASRDSEPRTSI